MKSILWLAAGLWAGPLDAAPTDEADRAALLDNVREIDTDGIPGGVSVCGDNAFALVAGREGNDALLPVVAATRWEKGRVVVFGHDGFLRTPDQSGNGILFANAVRWAAGDAPQPRIGVLREPALLAYLQARGVDAVELQDRDWVTKLTGIRVVALNAMLITSDDLHSLTEFVTRGGGMVTGLTGWGWVQINRSDNLGLVTDCPVNRLLAPAGLVFSANTPQRIASQAYPAGGDLALLNANAALRSIAEHPGISTGQCTATIANALRSLPSDDRLLLPRLAELAGKTSALPSPETPVRAGDPLARLLVIADLERLRRTPVAGTRAHPAAAAFPGAVPAAAPRLENTTVVVDTAISGWHGTGLYAAPGETIGVALPVAAVDKSLRVRIGCHSDALWHLDAWRRMPEITRSVALKSPSTAAANPFGGLIYIEVPGHLTGVYEISIRGGVASPRFVLGKTTTTAWREGIRDAPAPWAELETAKVILSVPSAKIRNLEDPAALLGLWDRILDAEADLATIPHERPRPERIVPDLQISSGYMHSGYPIMTWLDHSVDISLSTGLLGAGSWGHFHELGHNHQQRAWTFEGTVEVTCNLFSLYVMETICGKPAGQGHEAMAPDAVSKRLRDHLAKPDRFTRWKNDPFLALILYNQLRAGFGWETFRKVFADYRATPAAGLPQNDEAKRDQWLVRFSRAAGRNLGPFFEAWGVPTSAAARDSIAALPTWMPEDWPQP